MNEVCLYSRSDARLGCKLYKIKKSAFHSYTTKDLKKKRKEKVLYERDDIERGFGGREAICTRQKYVLIHFLFFLNQRSLVKEILGSL